MTDLYRVMVTVDNQLTEAVLIELPEGLASLDMWARTEIPLGSPHKIEVELRRIK